MLLRLGRLAALVEGSAALVRRAAAAAEGKLAEKGSRRFSADALAAISRVNARDVALTVGTEAVRWVAGAGDGEGIDELASRLRLPEAWGAQAGLLADLDSVADAVYGRAS